MRREHKDRTEHGGERAAHGRSEKRVFVVDRRVADEVRRYLADTGLDVVSVEQSSLRAFRGASTEHGGRKGPADLTDDLEQQERFAQLLEVFFSQSLSGFFFMMLDEPIVWNDSVDKEGALDYAFTHQRMTKVNQALLDQYGAEEAEFLGLTPGELFQHDLAHGRRIWRGLFDRGRWHVETRERRMDGTPIVIDGDYLCLYDKQGRIIGHFGVQHDITERKLTIQSLEEERERMRSIMEATNTHLDTIDADFNLLHVDPVWQRIYGDPGGRKCYAYFMGRAEPCPTCRVPEALETGKVVVSEQYLTEEDRFFEVHTVPFRNAAGAQMVAEFNVDITERKRVERALARSEAYNAAVVEAIPDLIILRDRNGTYVDIMAPSEDKLALPAETLLQKKLEDVHTADDASRILASIRKALATGTLQTVEYELEVPAGRRWFEARMVPMANEEILSLIRDITERRLAEEAIRASEARHRQLFEDSPVALLEEDYSAVKRAMDALRAAGVTDLDAYFEDHPDVVRTWVDSVRFLRTNHAARALFATGGAKDVLVHMKREAPTTLCDLFRREFIDLFAGQTDVSYRAQERDSQGNTLETVVRLSVVPGHEEELDRVLVSIQDVTEQVRAQAEVEQSYLQVRKIFEGTVASLSALSETRDPYTAGHQRRVARLACAIGGRLRMDEERGEGLRVAALLHDIGKVSVAAEILNKPTQLTGLEFRMIREHSRAGSDILRDIAFPWPVAEIVLQHHERLDGSGYPQGLTEQSILLEAQVLAVADVVEAMASHRPYRPAPGVDAALAEIRAGAGTLYNEHAVAVCVELFAEGFVLEAEV